jgi:hypothetical protein
MQPLLPQLSPGWDLVLVARSRLVSATFQDVSIVVEGLLRRADLFIPAIYSVRASAEHGSIC